ncbi:MAG: molybdopterin biosynthesis protein [Anaerolineales bacterium]|nr:molybdopterin biosynthesis protein [Anaerolineales bacterium]
MKTSNIYLHDIPLEEARNRFHKAISAAGLGGILGEEQIPLQDAAGQKTSRAVWAQLSSPHYHAAAMDGFAIRAQDTEGASDRDPAVLNRIQYVDTGDPMPAWADAVIPVELVENLDSGDLLDSRSIHVRLSLPPWKHVRPMGEDMVATQLVLPANHILRPVDLGAIAGSGHHEVWVIRKPRVAIIPTGTELVPVGARAQAGEIIEYNSLVLAAQVEIWGGTATRYPIVEDRLETIQQQTAEAARIHDLVLVNAGSSAGSEDFTAEVVSNLGTLLVHGIAVRPGHPVILGMLERAKTDGSTGAEQIPVIGIPGYPVSAALTGEIFVEPLLALWTGRKGIQRPVVEAVLTRKVHSSPGDDEYLRVTAGKVGERIVAAPLARGAGVISSLVRSDGIVHIPAGVQGIQSGEKVQVELYCSPEDLEKTLVVLGSHDLTIDLIAQELALMGFKLSSGNLGSLGGLIALRRGEAHFAGSHLMDPESGEYNLSYIRRYLPDTPVVLVNLVTRQQGLILQSGNPEGIHSLEDIARPDITYVNRQRGAGTRVLLDYHLEQLRIDPAAIKGYAQEEYTHLTVAAAVASNRAHCGLGIRAAADALNLDFLPLYQERYDLVFPRTHFESVLIQPVLEILENPLFRNSVAAMPGYDVEHMGEIIAELG